ncbi:MAG: glycosyltransferase family 2 protein [Candidatus Doudnabacteria bacterium]|nr:glycosyltransferase family 2 protein [Candidatus Doudnabacteria bacterium]
MEREVTSIFERRYPRIVKADEIGEFSSETSVDLSILILNYKTPTLVRQCLKSIEKFPPQGYTYEVIVIDNDSRDGLGEFLEDEFPGVTFIPNEVNLGFPKAMNQGLRLSKGRYVLLLNPDITVLDDALTKMMNKMEEEQDIGMLGPKLLNPNGSLQHSCLGSYTTIPLVIYRRTKFGETKRGKGMVSEFLMEDWDHSSTREVAWMLGSSLLARRTVIEKVGLMDERFFMYLEDVDWCRRFRDAGYRVTYFPEAQMIHYYARGSASPNIFMALTNRLTRVHIASAVKFWMKYRNHESKPIPEQTDEQTQATAGA